MKQFRATARARLAFPRFGRQLILSTMSRGSVRYGSRVLELAKNKYAVEVAAEVDLIKTLDVIKTAVLAGELDTQIDAAVTKLRAGFARSVR